MDYLDKLFASDIGSERGRLQQLLESGIEAQRLQARGAGDIQLAEQKFNQDAEARRRDIERRTQIQAAKSQARSAQTSQLAQIFTFALALGLPKAFNLLGASKATALSPRLSLGPSGTGFGTFPR